MTVPIRLCISYEHDGKFQREEIDLSVPTKLRILWEEDEDDRYHYVGRYGEGWQFMGYVTGAFPGKKRFPNPDSDWQSIKRWYAVLHTFDADGNHLHAEAHSGGTTADGQQDAVDRAYSKLDEMIRRLGTVELGDIEVKLFSVEIDGYLFELIYEYSLDISDSEWRGESVMHWPRDIMFHPPWDSGKYST